MNTTNSFASFWARFGAYILDSFILIPISIGFQLLNFYTVRNFFVYLLIVVPVILYKPYFEYKWGATLGKMIVGIKVTDYDFEKISFNQSMMRSLIFILPTLLLLPSTYLLYTNPELKEVESFWKFSQAAGVNPIQTILSCFISLLGLTDLIFLLADDTGKGQSLHDRIGKTYVVMKY